MITTIDVVKIQLWITDDSQDALLQQLLDQANWFIESFCKRKFEESDYTDFYDWHGENILNLQNFPVNTLTSLQKNTWTITSPVWENIDADKYVVNKKSWQVRSALYFPYWLENIKVVYNAWYSSEDMPQDLVNACVSLVGYYYNTKNWQGIASESVDGASIRYSNEAIGSTIPSEILQTLNMYKQIYV